MKQLFICFFLLFSAALYAQPANDNCSGVIDLGVAPACPQQFFSNLNATASDIGFGNNPTCFNGGLAPRDVWFSFTTNDTTLDYSITVTGLTNAGVPAMRNPQIALYRGECQVDGLAELLCGSAPNGETILRVDAYGLTPNVTYFLRISDYSPTGTPNWGSFQLCVDQLSPNFNIDEGSSSACFGVLYDTGGPDGDYSNNETHTFTICPTDFHQCITFTLDYYNLEGSDFQSPDQLAFYDAATPDPAALIGSIGGAGFPTDGGGGGVCYTVQASSGCLTVQFTSDGNVTQEGFAGQWQCSTNPCEEPQPITIQGDITEQQILNSITSLQTLVNITDINCPSRAYGVFQATDDTELGLEKGLLLTSGSINWAIGPNDNAGGGNTEANNNAPGDPDLDYLSETFGDGSESNDACIIELDVTAFTNEITFEYIFASEEYPEFVNDFNDIFAFLISGPGIVGDPNIGNQQNIAVLPDGSNTLVEINTINNLVNWQYYRNNENGQATQYDGMTSDFLGVKKSLTARASVIPCSTYHLKIAVADRLDFQYDSGVFISEIRGGTPKLDLQFNSGIDYLIENCTNTPDGLNVELSNVLDQAATYRVVVGGTATRDVDYTLNIPDTVVFQPGQTDLSFIIAPLNDNLAEDTETITISLTNNFGCGEVVYTTLTIELRDQLVVDIQPDADTVFVCQGSNAQLRAEGASTYFWTPVSIISDPLSPSPQATPTGDIWVRVEGNVGICAAVDSVFLKVIDPVIEISALDPVAICRGDSVRLQVTDNVNNTNLIWSPAGTLSDTLSVNVVAVPDTSITYFASVRLFDCVVTDSITIDVNPFEFPELANDTLVCQNYPVRLAELFDAEATVYSWSPNIGLDDPELSGPLATPDLTTTYTLIAQSENGACADTAQITIEVVPADVDIQQPDTLEICLGTVVPMEAVTSTGSADGLRWSTTLPPSLSDTIGLNVVTTPTQTATYFTRFEIGDCIVFDSVYVRVDSLPLSPLTANPQKDPYCPGEIVLLTSPLYEPAHFPDIEFEWLPSGEFETADSLWNMVLTTSDTNTFFRVITNRGCLDTTSITLNVVDPPTVVLTPSDTLICPGESVQLIAEGYEDYPFRWETTTGLSCTDCPNPIATPDQTTSYTFVAEVPNCPVGATAVVRVEAAPTVSPVGNRAVCLGSPVQLNSAFDEFTRYEWRTSTDTTLFSTDPLLTVAPLNTTTYVLSATRGSCPSRVFNITITVVQPPTANAGPDQVVCAGSAASLAGTIGGAAEGGIWTTTAPGTFTPGPTALNAVFTPTEPGDYVLFLTATDPNNVCPQFSDELNLTVNATATASAGADTTICADGVVSLNGVFGGAATSAIWGTSSPGGVFNPNQITPNATYTPPAGTTSVELTFLTNDPDGPCPAASDVMTVTIVPRATVDAGPDFTICRGEPIDLEALGTAASGITQTYRWTGPGIDPPADTNRVTIANTNTLISPAVYVISYAYGPNLSCGEVFDTVRVTIAESIQIDSLVSDKDTVIVGNEVLLTAFTTPDNPTGAMYLWSVLGDTPTMGESSITVRPSPEFPAGSDTEQVSYELTVKSADGCISTRIVTITVTKPPIEFPNVFTPNGDGINDLFRPVPVEAISVLEFEEFKVYNRWGQVVYDGKSNNYQGWDGTHNGRLAPSDVYVYRVKAQFRNDDKPVDAQGEVTLIR